jgi:hypothetical protein
MKKNRTKSNVLKDAGIPVFQRNGNLNWYFETHRIARDGIIRPDVPTMSSALR